MFLRRNRGLAFKLAALVLMSITLILLLILSYNYYFSRRLITDKIEENAIQLTKATVNRIDSVLRATEKVPANLSPFIDKFSDKERDLTALIESAVMSNPEIYGATIAFEPYGHKPDSKGFAPYCYREKDKIRFTRITYDYFFWDWYQIPKELDRPAWIEPYFDEDAGNILMSTYAVPFYRIDSGKKIFAGVITADISLSWLQETVAGIKIAKTGYGFLITKNGTFVTHPDQQLIMNETIFSLAEARGDKHLREIGRDMIRGKTGFVRCNSLMTGKSCWLAYAPLPSNGWAIGVLFPQDELMADVTRLNRMVLGISLGGFFFIMIVIVLIARTITGPLRALTRTAEEISGGNLDVTLPPIKSKDEVGRLAGAFDSMKSSLKTYIRELTETTAARERIESELRIAHEIQMGILPKIFPAFPERPEFDLYATIEPAREVGGDLYDFFFMDEDHLCFTVGDVSGKGVPASLFMAVTKTMIKTKATQGLTPEMVLTRVNQDLSIDNPSMMFVTLFLGILNIRTGSLAYCNGGHNPPYFIRGAGGIEPLESTEGMALGVMEDFNYFSKRINLHKGDTLYIYTDGVTEATNAAEELFSEKRLEQALDDLKESPIEDLVSGVMDRVRIFSEGVPQADDITMMILRYNGI